MATGNPNDAWQTLVTTALLGTSRGDVPVPTLYGSAAELLKRAPAETAEQRLLVSAGIISLYQRAGRRPGKTSLAGTQSASPLPAAPEDQIPPCSLRAASQLHRVLEIGLDDVLRDWCRAAGAARVRAPDELLPALLNLVAARKDEELGDAIAAVLGARGRWLAALNPAWAATLSPEAEWESQWQTGSKDERLAALRGLRRRDAARARELVQSTWVEEDSETRVAILQVLRTNVSLKDEPLLETALVDKRKQVRLAAADLLVRLPGSKYCQRISEQARRFVQFESKRGLLRRQKLTLAVSIPPDDFKLSHEGIEAKASGDIGPRAMMLAQMIAATPLVVWTQAANAGPEEILAVAHDNEWCNVLILGWTHAAACQGETGWAAPLLKRFLECKSVQDLARLRVRVPELMACLDPPERERLAIEAARRYAKAGPGEAAWDIVMACDQPWSQVLSETVLKGIVARIEKHPDRFDAPSGRETAAWLGVHMNPGLSEEVLRSWSSSLPDWRPALQRFGDELLSLLQFRREYLKELSP